MKTQAIRSIVTVVGLAGALLGAVQVAQAGQAFFLNAPGSLTKTDVNGAHSVTATETLTAASATLDITANVGTYLAGQNTLFSNGQSANTFENNKTNTTDGDIVHLAPPGTTTRSVSSNIQSNFQ